MNFLIAKPEHADLIARFVNSAYRGETSRQGWTTEADLLSGQRADPEMIRQMMSRPHSAILLAREPELDPGFVGCVDLIKVSDDTCQLGMLTVKPDLQNKGIGRKIMVEAECYARGWNCKTIKMSVIAQRRELIDWYCRRGYVVTPERAAFPYGDARFGMPNHQDLFFLILKKQI